MPIANITRILRRVLPTHAKIADDAKEAIQECVSEFISFITAEANRRCRRDYRRTVTPEDVLAAMASLGFGDYLESLTVFLNNHRTQQDPERGSRNQISQSVRRDGGIEVGFLHHHQPQGAPMVRPPPPPPLAASTMGYYVPLPPPVAATMEDEEEFGGLPKATNEFSGGEEFDPFQ
ncbi:PREDICTED: nuclear transcription factor Y subunit B-1-like [Erythranthe guttata]|nr:PREDICTED: nuclear transcription factor Y subunit B-1-like [Erythranthe guttata]|eukprot:XP_012857606.1 PREDICTED: nuclear transcription factor Y subunit B-1-like [Erythranthe guttata]